jgi:hypothetical protein
MIFLLDLVPFFAIGHFSTLRHSAAFCSFSTWHGWEIPNKKWWLY